MALQCPGATSGSGLGDPEAKFTTANDGECPAGGGVFKPQHDRTEMDSPNASDAPTAMEEKQEDAGTRTLEETLARGLPQRPVRRAGSDEEALWRMVAGRHVTKGTDAEHGRQSKEEKSGYIRLEIQIRRCRAEVAWRMVAGRRVVQRTDAEDRSQLNEEKSVARLQNAGDSARYSAVLKVNREIMLDQKAGISIVENGIDHDLDGSCLCTVKTYLLRLHDLKLVLHAEANGHIHAPKYEVLHSIQIWTEPQAGIQHHQGLGSSGYLEFLKQRMQLIFPIR
ncbi:hypothetical protein NDU88_005738 [Pleurodeles waltl]|uniref:Uncharacterized protein n=1 Tax=Pleurodeles waltl TaxID=8319 RepID=A0AAV7WZF0_PLEWA|nr:hypothetical protein NDU88_005738 [Pleurodeles waltl]